MEYQLRRKQVQSQQSEPEQTQKGSKIRTRKYREGLRQNSTKLAEIREKDRIRKKQERLQAKQLASHNKSLLDEKRRKKREEMQRYRAKKKTESENSSKNPIRTQSMNLAKQKAKKKALNASNYISKQTKEAKKKTKVLNTKAWRLRIQLQRTSSKEEEQQELPSSSFSSYHAEYRATKRAKTSLPMTPEKKAKVIENILTPKTAKVLENRGLIQSPEARKTLQLGEKVMDTLKSHLKEVKPKGGSSKKSLTAYKLLKSSLIHAPISKKSKLRGMMKKYFDIKRGIPHQKNGIFWQEKKRKRRKDKIPDTVRCRVESFYLSPEISRELPLKREAMKVKDESGAVVTVQKNIMVMSMKEAFGAYKGKYPDDKIGLTTFKGYKPKNIKKVSETNRRTCLCTACSNVALKVEAVKKFSSAMSKDISSKETGHICIEMQGLTKLTKAELASSSLCRYDQFPFKKCLERTCEKCNKVSEILAPLQAYEEKSINWCHWEYIIVKKGEENKRQISCIEKSTTVSAFLEALQIDLQTYPYHMFRANWQHRQMAENQKSLKEGEIQLVMDFSENYRCAFKDEVQTGFFDQVQVTIHPMMAYYFKDGALMKHVIVGISPDTRHDAHLVKVFEDKALNLIAENTNVQTVYEWTDGCAAQYKGKHAFADISLNQTRKITRSFFETSHGKGVCDGIGAVVKNVCFRAVVTGKAILGNAEMVFKYCKEKLAHGPEKKQKPENEITIWDVIYSGVVGHDRTEVDVATLKGTRLLHSIKGIDLPYKVAIRTLSCFCEGCLTDSQCLNSEWVDKWTIKELKLSRSASDASILYTY